MNSLVYGKFEMEFGPALPARRCSLVTVHISQCFTHFWRRKPALIAHQPPALLLQAPSSTVRTEPAAWWRHRAPAGRR